MQRLGLQTAFASFTFLYINSLLSFTFHELTERSEWEAAPLSTICECEMYFVVETIL